MIRKTLDETPASEAEWIMWVDIDTIMPDMAVLPRFDAYTGADLVVWGNRDKINEGNLNEGGCQSLVGCKQPETGELWLSPLTLL